MPTATDNQTPVPSGVENIRRARWATSALFLIDGIGFGLWASLLPWLQHRLGLSNGELGGVLLGMVAGAFVAMPLTGWLTSRFGSRLVLGVVAPVFCLALCAPVFAATQSAVILAAVLFGALKGAFDVSINTQAVAVEQAHGRPVMATFQALWSIGGLVAALLVGGLLHAGIAPPDFTLLLVIALIVLALVGARALLREVSVDDAVATDHPPVLTPAVLRIGVLAFIALFTEGVLMDWGAIYSSNVAGASTSTAPLAYGVFCAAMAGGRLTGDHIVAKLGTTRLLRWSGGLTALGLAIVIAVPWWPVTFIGLACAGLGLANLVPVFLRASGQSAPRHAGRSVAVVSMIGYLGFLIGPPAIGGLSEAMGLPLAFTLVLVLASLIAVAGPRLLRPDAARTATVTRITPGSQRLSF